jgi:UDP-glucose 4-epimerase
MFTPGAVDPLLPDPHPCIPPEEGIRFSGRAMARTDGRRTLVFGAAGFLGSHLTKRLVRDGWSVTGVVRDLEAPHLLRRLGDSLPDIQLVEADVNDEAFLEQVVAGADAVFPFAGESGAARSMRAPISDAEANVIGTVKLLEALRRVNPGATVLFPGSRLQYGRVKRTPVDEEHPQEPTSLYGLHKLVAEGYHRLYFDIYGLRTICFRISNPYGPFQDRPDRAFGVVGTFIARALNDEPLEIYSGGKQLRDYLFVEDLVDLCVRAVTEPAAVGQVFNVGGPRATSLKEMAEAVVQAVGRGRVVDAPWPELERSVETGDYVTDISRAIRMFGWQPTTSLEEGLRRTVETHRSRL